MRAPGSPSAAAVMVCADEAQQEIATALGVTPSEPPRATWSDQLYSCRYRYSDAALVLSVRESPDRAAAVAYLAGRRDLLASPRPMPGVGQEALAGQDGSIVVRKDSTVLTVDVSGLPERFGQPPQPRATVAMTVAMVVLACWTGS